MRLPGKNSPTPYMITFNPKFFPFFEDANGAIDGTHFPAAPPEEQKAAHQDHDGNITTIALLCVTSTCGSHTCKVVGKGAYQTV
jgi:hypothetical protein